MPAHCHPSRTFRLNRNPAGSWKEADRESLLIRLLQLARIKILVSFFCWFTLLFKDFFPESSQKYSGAEKSGHNDLGNDAAGAGIQVGLRSGKDGKNARKIMHLDTS